MYQNIINKIEEVTEAKTFSNINPYFVFLHPKEADSAMNVIVVEGTPTYQKPKKIVSFPLVTMMWNPIALNDLVITGDMVSNYRIFIGYIQ